MFGSSGSHAKNQLSYKFGLKDTLHTVQDSKRKAKGNKRSYLLKYWPERKIGKNC